MGLDDSETSLLLSKCHHGDREALNTLLEQHLPFVNEQVSHQLGIQLRQKVETGDIVQEAVVEFLRYAPRVRLSNENHLRALLCRIAENRIRDGQDWFTAKRREMARERPLPTDTSLEFDPPVDPVTTPSVIAQRHENEALVRFGLELLNPEERKVYLLRQWDNLSFSEVGKLLSTSEDAARMRFKRTCIKLSKIVGELRLGKLESALDKNAIRDET